MLCKAENGLFKIPTDLSSSHTTYSTPFFGDGDDWSAVRKLALTFETNEIITGKVERNVREFIHIYKELAQDYDDFE